MREYAIVPSKFWITPLAKLLRGNPAAQVVALYLKTGPHANMIGLYHCPIAYIAQDTGIPFEGASKALASLSEAGYCTFDEQADVVFIHDMAPEQVGAALAPADKRTKAVLREWSSVPSESLRRAFHHLYAAAFHLPPMAELGDQGQGASKPLAVPFEAPSKPLQSQEHEHAQDHAHDQGQEAPSSDQSPDGAGLTTSGGKTRKQHGTEDDYKAARWMIDRIRENDSTFKQPNLDAWANEVRLMREQDEREHREICELFGWCQRDQFWRANVLSPGKLRDKWGQLTANRARAAKPTHGAWVGMTDEQRAAAGAASTAEALKLLGYADTGKGEVVDEAE